MDHLPTETLIKIFSYLVDTDDLESVAAVSTRWREVIINSPEIMEHVNKCIERWTFTSKDQIFKLPYKNLLIDAATFYIFPPLPTDFSFLRKLTITETVVWLRKFNECSRLPMPHLKTLELDYGSDDMLSVIFCERLEHFSFGFEVYGGDESQFDETLEPFLALICDLKRLHFNYGFPRFNMSSYKFKLQFLLIVDAYDLPSHFIQFLQAQQSSLEELHLQVLIVEEPVLNYIYFEMNLTKLLDNHWNRVELKRKFNKSIKTLALSNRMYTHRDVLLNQQIILRCHSLEFLRIEFSPLRPRQMLQFLTSLMPRLKTVALSLEHMKNLKIISKWIKSNGYHVSLSSTCNYCVPQIVAKEGYWSWKNSRDNYIRRGLILFISSKESASNFNQFGKVIDVNAFHQFSQYNPGGTVEIKNLAMYKQKKRVEKSLQIRMFIEHVIVTTWFDLKGIFLNFSDKFEEDEIIENL